MRIRRYVLDTNVCLHVLKGALAVPLPAGGYSISAVTEIELFSKPGLTIAEQIDIRAFLALLPIIKLPDAIVAATALSLGAELLSNDRQMARVPGLIVTPLALKP